MALSLHQNTANEKEQHDGNGQQNYPDWVIPPQQFDGFQHGQYL
jgi:hypothetical protein